MNDTRVQNIVEEAHGIILTPEGAAMTVEQIAERIGVAKKTIYNHFRTKRDLVDAVLGHDTELWLASVAAVMDDPREGFAEKTSRVLAQTLDKLQERDRLLPRLRGVREEIFEARTQEAFQRSLIGPISRLIHQGIRDGHVKADVDPEAAAYVLLNMTSGVLSFASCEQVPYQPYDLLIESLRFMAAGILTDKGQREAHFLETDR